MGFSAIPAFGSGKQARRATQDVAMLPRCQSSCNTQINVSAHREAVDQSVVGIPWQARERRFQRTTRVGWHHGRAQGGRVGGETESELRQAGERILRRQHGVGGLHAEVAHIADLDDAGLVCAPARVSRNTMLWLALDEGLHEVNANSLERQGKDAAGRGKQARTLHGSRKRPNRSDTTPRQADRTASRPALDDVMERWG